MAIKRFIHRYLNVTAENIYAKNCLYDNSFDQNFIIDIHPQHPQVGFAAGLSEHAYKMSYVLATHLLLLDRVMGIQPKHDVSFLSLKRFKSFDCVIRIHSWHYLKRVQLYFFKISLYYKFSF